LLSAIIAAVSWVLTEAAIATIWGGLNGGVLITNGIVIL